MCIIYFSYETYKDYRLFLIGNRDEFYNRPTKDISFWEDFPQILGGRDLIGKGTWLGITKTGRIAAITNFRDPLNLKANSPSRGDIVFDFLCENISTKEYLEYILKESHKYNGFNIIVDDGKDVGYFSNKIDKYQILCSGNYALSNHLLDKPWPKVIRIKSLINDFQMSQNEMNFEHIFEILKDNCLPVDELLPDTGVGIEWERILGPIFVSSNIYGTRSSSILLVKQNGEVTFLERTFNPYNTKIFNFKINDSKSN
ncbi:MAG: NRDE family protein [Desulfobacterales bacterium]|nr:NRDE family protein [Desulfobacterales bacterium]